MGVLVAAMLSLCVVLERRPPQAAAAVLPIAAPLPGKSEPVQELKLQVSRVSAPMPQPAPRLRHIGASFVLPLSQIAQCKTSPVFTFRIPTLPASWPLRAIIRRNVASGAWEKIELTVEDSNSTPLPTLLSCSVAGQEESKLGRNKFAIENSGGAVVASIIATERYCTVERDKQPAWGVEIHNDGQDFWVGVFLQGEKIGQAISFKQGASQRAEYMQVDTQADVQSPESALMLLCFLVVLVIQLQAASSGWARCS